MPSWTPSILLLIPAYNEESRIGPVLRDYAAYFRANYPGRFQLVVVLNGCRDNTLGVVQSAAREFPEISAMEHKLPIGKGGALIEGLRLAPLADLVGYVDADGATAPAAFLDLVKLCADYDCVIGSRWIKGAVVHQEQPNNRQFVSRAGHHIIEILFRMGIADTQCGAKVMRRAAIEKIHSSLRITDMAFDVNLLYMLKRTGFRILEHPTEWTDKSGSKVALGRMSLSALLSVVRLRLVYSRFHWMRPFFRPLETWLYKQFNAPPPIFGKERELPGPKMLAKYSFGIGDRFAHQGKAQLRAIQMAAEQGAKVVPVWNKSNREHLTIGSEPSSTRVAAEAAVRDLGWKGDFHVDADHIRLETVDRFLPHSDYYTIDVADSIGKPADEELVQAFIKRHPELSGRVLIPEIPSPFEMTPGEVRRVVRKYLLAVQEAGKIYRHIAKAKVEGSFITEVSMDETDAPQTPPELLIILAALADEGIPAQTIAPKFTGRFNKGVDYVGDIGQFEKEFNDDLAVIAHAVKKYVLPANLKLSVHSGSDKFSIYAPIRRALVRFDAGVHVKTAGTTWLEEVIGLAEAGGAGLALAKELYGEALERMDELCAPYAAVIDIDRRKLPSHAEVSGWTRAQFVAALRHEPANPQFNPHLRQLLHVGYKMAAKKGPKYLEALDQFESSVAKNVSANLFERHLKPLFLG